MELNSRQKNWMAEKYGGQSSPVSSLDHASRTTPEKHAKQLTLSEEYNLPVSAISSIEPEATRLSALKSIKPEEIARNHPKTANFLSDVDNASLAFNDIDNLRNTESALLEKKREWYEFRPSKIFENFGDTFSESMSQGLRGLHVAMIDAAQSTTYERGGISIDLPKDPEILRVNVDKIVDEINAGDKKIQSLTPADLSILENGVRSGIDSVIRNLPGMAASIATRKPIFSVAPMVGQVSAEAYGTARSKGLSQEQSSVFAVTEGGIEYITERIPAGKLLDIVGEVGGKKTVRAITEYVISEIGGEQLATLGQTINSYVHGLDEQLENAKDFDEVLDIQGERQAITFFASLVGSGVQSGIAVGAGAAERALINRSTKELDKTFDSQAEQATIDRLINLAQSNDIKDLSPEKYTEFIASIPSDQEIHIPVESIQGLDVPASISGKVDKTGADIVISAGEFMSELAHNDEIMTAIRPHIKMSGDAKSSSEIKTEKNVDIESLIKKATKAKDIRTEADSIYEDIKEQLVSTGRQSVETARFSAAVMPAYISRYVERAKEKGHDVAVKEVYGGLGLKVKGPKSKAATIVEQRSPSKQNLSGVEITEDAIVEETGEKVTVTEDAQVIWDEAQERRTKLSDLLDCVNAS